MTAISCDDHLVHKLQFGAEIEKNITYRLKCPDLVNPPGI